MELQEVCDFSENRMYIMMAIARKNENPSLTHNTEVVFREPIRKSEDLKRKQKKLWNITQGYTDDSGTELRFRLYMTINPRDALSGYWRFRDRMNGWAEDMMNGDDAAAAKLKKVDSYWLSELQKPENRAETHFIFDVDDCTREEMERLWGDVSKHTQPLLTQETPNGYHIVTEPFNYNELNSDVDYELKTDGMLFLERL